MAGPGLAIQGRRSTSAQAVGDSYFCCCSEYTRHPRDRHAYIEGPMRDRGLRPIPALLFQARRVSP
jgi:hypothetical protein